MSEYPFSRYDSLGWHAERFRLALREFWIALLEVIEDIFRALGKALG